MRLKKLQLRGAIGIWKGLGLEEIEIDFSKFDGGLIALVGENGRGKTTIIENLHPYRRLVTREGNIADHFYLKDSYRKLEFVLDEKTYRSEIYIDGLTKKVEAYLIENGIALNDGKLTTYDSMVETTFGSEELFFNSIFSAQKSQGLSKLNASEKRDLFYELLRLNDYERYCSRTKELVKLLDEERIKELTISNLLNEELSQITATKEEFDLLENEHKEITKKTIEMDKELKEALLKKEQLGRNISQLEVEKEKQRHINQYIEILNGDIDKSQSAFDQEQKRMEESLRLRLIKVDMPNEQELNLRTEQQKIEAEINSTPEKIESLRITSEINLLLNDVEGFHDEILANKEILKSEGSINEQIKKRESLKSDLTDILQKEIELKNELARWQSEEKSALNSILPLYEEVDCIEKKRVELKSKIDLFVKDKEHLYESYSEKKEVIEKDLKNLECVPCDEITGSNCPFLSKAYMSKEEKEMLENAFTRKLEILETLIGNTSKELA